MGDLKLNVDLRAGEIKCHRLVDILLTADGDLALTGTDQETMMQKLLIYFATPKGEMVDPLEGSVFYDYMHKSLTANHLASMSVVVRRDLVKFFPELGVFRVALRKAERRNVFMTIHCSDGALEYLFSPEDVLDLQSKLSQSWESFKWEVGDVMGGGVY